MTGRRVNSVWIVAGVIAMLVSPPGLGGEDVGNAIARSDVSSVDDVIRVGVRTDAKPFSYIGHTDGLEDVLSEYRGYMIRICRKVLREMTSVGPFKGVRVQAVPVLAKDRFDKLANGEVDLLCGPDSITSSRLRYFNVSHALFLSGMTYGYIDPESERFPRSEYCGAVVGVLQGTTASTSGLRELADRNLLLRFDEPVEKFLATSPTRLRGYDEAEARIRQRPEYADPDRDIWHLLEPAMRVVQANLAKEMVTSECPNGTKGLPVRMYQTHDAGIRAFCAGKVLYYLGDYDIIKRKVDAISDCPVVLERFTTTREVYGAFLRKGSDDSSQIAGSSGQCIQCSVRDLLLYSLFNSTLLRMMQNDINILEYAYLREFGDLEKSDDLQQFFLSLKIASDE